MTIYYKSVRYINGKTRWTIEDEYGNVIDRNPSKEKIKNAIDYTYRDKFKEMKCCLCKGSETGKASDGGPDWRKYFGDSHDEAWDEKSWVCSICNGKIRRKLPDSHNNIVKELANIRIGNVKKDSNEGKYIIDQAVVSKTLGIEDLNIKMDNFNWYIDLENERHEKIDVKSSSLYLKTFKEYEYEYDIYIFHTGRKIDCDIYVCLGYDRYRKVIDMVWIIHNDEYIINKSSITVMKSPNGLSMYEEFRVDEKPYNSAYQSLMKYLKDKKYFGIEDIKNWLNNI